VEEDCLICGRALVDEERLPRTRESKRWNQRTEVTIALQNQC
jgi:hypothetical protein